MSARRFATRMRCAAVAAAFSATLGGGSFALAGEAASAAGVPTAAPAQGIARRAGESTAVSIYEFRSSISSVSARNATDMFTTALVQCGRFTVVERSRLQEGVWREKQLNTAGHAGGDAGQTPLRAARYLFEGAVTQADEATAQRSATVGIGGLQIGRDASTDEIAVDVRVVDAGSGEIVDVVSVRKSIRSQGVSVGGVGTLLRNVLPPTVRNAVYAPDVQVQQQRSEGIDAALREAIEQAVRSIASRFAG